MKTILSIAILFLSLAAQAEALYRCDLQVGDKAGRIGGQDRVIYLSHNRYSNIQLSAYETELSLIVEADQKVTGSVDGRPNFIIRGTTKNVQFESAKAYGNIMCDAAVNHEAALYFKPWRTIVVTGDKDLYTDLRTAKDVPNYCYFGSTSAAVNLVASALGTAPDKLNITKEQDIEVHTVEQKCVRSIGAYDDYQCLEWKAEKVTRALQNCDYREDNR